MPWTPKASDSPRIARSRRRWSFLHASTEHSGSTRDIVTVRYDKRMVALNLLIKQKAIEAGFDMVGIAPVGVWGDLDFARRWVEQGYGGEMHYLQNPRRDDPRQVLPSAESAVCVGLVYNAPLPYSTEVGSRQSEAGSQERAGYPSSVVRRPLQEATGPGQWATDHGQPTANPEVRTPNLEPRAWISRYAWGRDYHDVMRKKLEQLRTAIEQAAPGAETRVYVDTGPVVERAFARHSSIGWMGKNTCLINPTKGSWFFLGVLLTNLRLEPDLPTADRCGSCTRCLDACPTGALVKPYVMDASRCIAYFTIELKGSIPEDYRPAIGSNVFGCDICQDVCPWNRSQKPGARSLNQEEQTLRGSSQPSAGGKRIWPHRRFDDHVARIPAYRDDSGGFLWHRRSIGWQSPSRRRRPRRSGSIIRPELLAVLSSARFARPAKRGGFSPCLCALAHQAREISRLAAQPVCGDGQFPRPPVYPETRRTREPRRSHRPRPRPMGARAAPGA
jgi:epoxyqueuosine reductase